jgi:hypothetical protein
MSSKNFLLTLGAHVPLQCGGRECHGAHECRFNPPRSSTVASRSSNKRRSGRVEKTNGSTIAVVEKKVCWRRTGRTNHGTRRFRRPRLVPDRGDAPGVGDQAQDPDIGERSSTLCRPKATGLDIICAPGPLFKERGVGRESMISSCLEASLSWRLVPHADGGRGVHRSEGERRHFGGEW